MTLLKSINRKLLIPIIKKSNLSELLSTFTTNNNLILNYHGVVKNYDPNLSKNHLPLKQFEEQMEYFNKQFKILTIEEIFKNKKKKFKSNREKFIAITFDDGYKNNLDTAFPVLNSLNIPATIFVTGQSVANPTLPLWYDFLDLLNSKLLWDNLKTEFRIGLKGFDIGNYSTYSSFKNYVKTTNPEFKLSITTLLNTNTALNSCFKNCNKEYWELMTQEDLILISSKTLIEIGSHSHTHSNLDQISESDLKNELELSKINLENCINKKAVTIAFPDGAYNEKVKKACRNAGYERMLAVDYRTGNDIMDLDILPRLSISNTTTSDAIIVGVNLAFRKTGF